MAELIKMEKIEEFLCSKLNIENTFKDKMKKMKTIENEEEVEKKQGRILTYMKLQCSMNEIETTAVFDITILESLEMYWTISIIDSKVTCSFCPSKLYNISHINEFISEINEFATKERIAKVISIFENGFKIVIKKCEPNKSSIPDNIKEWIETKIENTETSKENFSKIKQVKKILNDELKIFEKILEFT